MDPARRGRRHVDDDTTTLLHHGRQHRTAAPQGRHQRTRDLGRDLGSAELGERLEVDRPAHVVDQDIDAPEVLDALRHHLGGTLPGLQVGLQRNGVNALLHQAGHHLLNEIGAIHQRQACALGGGSLGDPPPDPLGGTGDHHDLAVETTVGEAAHALPPASLGVNFS